MAGGHPEGSEGGEDRHHHKPSTCSVRNSLRKAVKIILESPGGAALISVVFGGLALGILSMLLQNELKERELQLLDAQNFSRERFAATRELYSLTGRATAFSREALALAEADFRPDRPLPADQQENLNSHRARVVREYNQFLREWNAQRESLGLLLRYYYPCSPEIAETWLSVEEACNLYLECSIRAKSEQEVEECAVSYYRLSSFFERLSEHVGEDWRRTAQSRSARWGEDCK